MKTPATAKITTMTLTAAMAAIIWTMGCGVTDNGNDAQKKVAVFNGKSSRTITVPTYTLTINIAPAGSGMAKRSPNQTSYNAGTTVTACATPAVGHEFAEWTGAVTSAETCVAITMDDNKTLTANFKEARIITPAKYTLTVYAADGGAVSLPENSTYRAGATVTVTAIPDEGHAFTGWTGAQTSAEPSVTVTMDSNKALTANFQQTGLIDGGTLTYEGQNYRTIIVGGKRWMAENLNFEASISWCYGNSPDSCAKYGRLYAWDAAKSACPAGWHLPSRSEWANLVQVAGGDSAGRKLKSTSGWRYNGNGTDIFGFSALPGGHRYSSGGSGFEYAGLSSAWWSATEYYGSADARYAYFRYTDCSIEYVYEGYNSCLDCGYSVRCVHN